MSLKTLTSDLVSVEWLADNINERSLVLLDASYFMVAKAPQLTRNGKDEWLKETIPGARFFDFDKSICDQNSHLPHMMPSAEHFQQSVQSLGINQTSTIIVFDRLGIFSSPRVWWMFKSMGFNNIAVLDGGLLSWKEGGQPVRPSDEFRIMVQGDFIANYQTSLIADKQDLLKAIEDKHSQIIDARTAARFLGEAVEPRPELRSGHMPTAKNLPFTSLLENGKMRDIKQLKSLFSALIDKQQNVIFSCGSGVTACVLALGARLCGYKNLTVYDASWTEWGADTKLPIVK